MHKSRLVFRNKLRATASQEKKCNYSSAGGISIAKFEVYLLQNSLSLIYLSGAPTKFRGMQDKTSLSVRYGTGFKISWYT